MIYAGCESLEPIENQVLQLFKNAKLSYKDARLICKSLIEDGLAKEAKLTN